MEKLKNLKLIMAVSDENIIGTEQPNEAGSYIPWRVKEDMALFKKLTLGGVVVMGRKTWETLPERFRPLPGRENIVLSRDPEFLASGAVVLQTVDQVLEYAQSNPEKTVWIMGGAIIYAQFIQHVSELHITRVNIPHLAEEVESLGIVCLSEYLQNLINTDFETENREIIAENAMYSVFYAK